MTQLMETLIDQLHEIPEEEQDGVAARLLEDLKSERRWDELFASTTEEQWDKLEKEALDEFERGETKSMEDTFREL